MCASVVKNTTGCQKTMFSATKEQKREEKQDILNFFSRPRNSRPRHLSMLRKTATEIGKKKSSKKVENVWLLLRFLLFSCLKPHFLISSGVFNKAKQYFVFVSFFYSAGLPKSERREVVRLGVCRAPMITNNIIF